MRTYVEACPTGHSAISLAARVRRHGGHDQREDHVRRGQVGAAADNAAMESFFALLQRKVLDRRAWETRDELRIAIAIWIERTYHRRRRQTALGRLTPIEYETIMTPTATKVA